MHVVFLTAEQIAEAYRDGVRASHQPLGNETYGEWLMRTSRNFGQQAAKPDDVQRKAAQYEESLGPDETDGLTADEIYEAERREDLRADCLQHAVMTMPDVTDQAAILARAQAFFDWIEG